MVLNVITSYTTDWEELQAIKITHCVNMDRSTPTYDDILTLIQEFSLVVCHHHNQLLANVRDGMLL